MHHSCCFVYAFSGLCLYVSGRVAIKKGFIIICTSEAKYCAIFSHSYICAARVARVGYIIVFSSSLLFLKSFIDYESSVTTSDLLPVLISVNNSIVTIPEGWGVLNGGFACKAS